MEERIRFATVEDRHAILAIYGKYILETAVSFEIVVPTEAQFQQRMEKIMAQYPYLVYEVDGQVLGYAYGSLHGERAAFCYDVELSIYFSDSAQRKGKASALYRCLCALLQAQGYYNAYACYAEPNEKSQRFHEKLGFEPVGTFRRTGYKMGKWHDLTWVAKSLEDHSQEPQGITPITALSPEIIEDILEQYQ